MILKDFTKRAILLAAYCLIFCAATIAQSLNPIFVDIDTTQFYRIANIEHSSGGIGIGAQHNSDIIVKHIDDSQELSDDCYWRIERDKEIIRFRNKSTGEYLAYSPEKDYKTFINLKLQATPTTQTEWRIDLRNGYFTFYHQADVEYYLSIEKADRKKRHFQSSIFEQTRANM